jgi:uncharacterized ferritin-like protein (DUF455 family)
LSVPFENIHHCLALQQPHDKCAAVKTLWDGVSATGLAQPVSRAGPALEDPGRPALPELIDPQKVPRRRLGSPAGRAALIHAIAHIEFNAINLALDAAWRFRGMPAQFYLDWLSVAADEARHYSLLEARLSALGHQYGDFPAHNGLWEMAVKTADSCLERMALVPRVLEARGLDVTPGMMSRLKKAGDPETVLVLEVILAEEVRHVEVGTRWFHHCCQAAGVDPDETFLHLLETRFGGRIKGPFNTAARIRAGFSEREMRALEAL